MKRFCLAILAFIFVLNGCKIRNEQSTTKHDPAVVISDSSPYQWIDLTDSEYLESRPTGSLFGGDESSDALSSDHPMINRLRFWLDVMDKEVRNHFGKEKLKFVPKPKPKEICKLAS